MVKVLKRAVAVLGLGVSIVALGLPQELPEVGPFGKVSADQALETLGEHFPEIAAQYGWSIEKLEQTFRQDNDVWVDSRGHLFYVCEGLATTDLATAETTTATQALAPLDETFLLHSKPNASKIVYLDFDGHVTSDTYWNAHYNDGNDIISAPFNFEGDGTTFSDNERRRIQYIWQRVAEDFAPFDVNVTTEDPGSSALAKLSSSDAYYGVRVVISPSDSWFGSAGGVAYVGSFNWSSDTPCFVFSAALQNGEKYIAEAASHEAGHTLGLRHDGTTTGTEYYSGHGSGETGWAPIMGVGYYKALTQWSKGEYADANNTEDDLQVMQQYGISYAGDDHGDTDSNATAVAVGTNISAFGTIETGSDVDVYKLTTGAGTISLEIFPDAPSPNLDALAQLYDASGLLVQQSNPLELVGASLSLYVEAGDYYLHVSGVGKGDPLTAYSDYGSLGQYSVIGTLVEPVGNTPPVAIIDAQPTSGEEPLTVVFSADQSYDADGIIESYAWDFGDGTTATGINLSHIYETTGTFQSTLTVIDNDGLVSSDNVTITVSAMNVAPSAVVSATPETGEAPLDVAFDGSGSSDSDGTIASYAWNFGDGTTGTGATVSHTYVTSGTYTATLTVTDDDGATDSATVMITVSAPVTSSIYVNAIDMTFRAVPDGNEFVVSVQIVDTAGAAVADATVTGDWDGFIKGSASATTDSRGYAIIVSRKTKKTGIVSFTVTDVAKTGLTYDSSLNVETTESISTDQPANNPPVAALTATPENGQPPLTVQFDGSQSSDPDGDVITYSWNFGDGTAATGVTAQHVYETNGTYEATLTVTDTGGAADTASVTIVVNDGTVQTLAVSNITLQMVSLPGRKTAAEATVAVIDSSGQPVSGATVSVQWSGSATNADAVVTDANGQVVFTSDWTRDNSGSFTVTIVDVSKTGSVYDPALNVETTETVNY